MTHTTNQSMSGSEFLLNFNFLILNYNIFSIFVLF
jgi:hypothetical protein